jgi:hypothetical protein
MNRRPIQPRDVIAHAVEINHKFIGLLHLVDITMIQYCT